MSLARTLAVTLTGLEGRLVDVEAHSGPGLPGFTLVGLPDAAVRESRERVRAALTVCGVTWGERRLTVNLSPADVRKTGTGFDLALALAVLGARGLLPGRALAVLNRTVYIGELGLDGSVHPVRGILPAVRTAVEAGVPDVVVAASAACEAALKAADLHEQEVWALQTVLKEARDVSSEAKNHTAEHITGHTTKVHGNITPDDVAAAQEVLQRPTDPGQEKTVDAESVAEAMRTCLQRLEIEGWEVVVDPGMAADMSVLGGKHRVKVRADATFAPCAVRQLLVHEIGTHVLRRHRAEGQRTPVARYAVGSAMRTEEGFAVCRENRAGVNFNARDRVYAARVLAVDIALRTGIVDVVDALAEHLDIDTAVGMAVRVKRGLENPHEPGANVKDHVYFTGSRMVEEHLRAHPDDLGLLFATKWPLEELPRVKALVNAGLVAPIPPELTDPGIVL
mgnify:CR=1 FL=1